MYNVSLIGFIVTSPPFQGSRGLSVKDASLRWVNNTKPLFVPNVPNIIYPYITMDRKTSTAHFALLQRTALEALDKGLTPGSLGLIKWLKLEKHFPDLFQSHQLITVALPNDFDLDLLKDKIKKIKYAYLKNALLTVEFHTAVGENLHIHALKKGNYQKGKIVRDLSRYFKIAPNFIDVESDSDPQTYLNRLSYINGEKSDPDKMLNCLRDQKWRKDNNFEEIYYL